MKFIIKPSELKELIENIKTKNNSINSIKILKTFVLVNPSEVANIVKEELNDNEICIIAFLPNVQVAGNNESISSPNHTAFFVIQRTDYSEFSNNKEWLDVFENTSIVAENIVNIILETHFESCGLLKFLDLPLIIEPVWHFAHCNGWEIELKTNINE